MNTPPPAPGPAVFLDPCWLAALDFARRHIAPGETLAAPLEFAFYFPQALACRPCNRGRTTHPQWIILSKDGREGLADFDFPSPATDYVPVWSNEFFIIFQLRILHPSATGRFMRRLSSRIKPLLSWRNSQRKARLPRTRPAPPVTGSTALVMTTHEQPSALARSLPQILALEVPVLLVTAGIPDSHRAAYDAVLAAHRSPRLHILSLPQNPGAACALNMGLFYWLADPAIGWISSFQDTVDVRPDLLEKLALVQDPDEHPLLSGYHSPDGLSLGCQEIHGVRVHHQWGAPGQHLHAHRRYWESVLPVPTNPSVLRHGGREEETGWWITVMAPGALWKNHRPVPCLPGMVRCFRESPEIATRTPQAG